MTKFLSLMKITLIEQLKLNKLFSKKNLFKKILSVIGVLILLAIVYFYIGSIFVAIAIGSQNSYGTEVILSTGLLMSSGLLIITSLARANAFLFKARDFDLLVSLPISLKTIVASKIASFVLASYTTLSFVFLPMIVVYSIYAPTNILFYVVALLVFILLPLLIIAVFSFVSYLLATLLARFKYKNVVAILGYLVMFVGIFMISFNSSGNPTQGNDIFEQLNNNLKVIYIPGFFAKEALLGNLINLVYFLLISVIPFALFVYVTGKLYLKINTRLSQTSQSKKFDTKNVDSKTSGVVKSLFKNEVKRFFSIPSYVINSISGKILMPIFVVLMYTQLKNEINEKTGFVVSLIVIVLMVFFVGMISTTSSSISLEGKNIWILRSSPIKFKSIVISKILLDIVITFIFSTVSLILMGILYKTDVRLLLIAFALLMVFGTHNALLGLIINLLFPKMNWDLPVKVVKQSLSVFLNMILGMVITVGIGIVGFKLLYTQSEYIIIGSAIGLSIILIGIEILILKLFGNKLFKKL